MHLHAASLSCLRSPVLQQPKLCIPPGNYERSCRPAWSSRGPCACCAKLLERRHAHAHSTLNAAAPHGVHSNSSSKHTHIHEATSSALSEQEQAYAREQQRLLQAVQHAPSFLQLSKLADKSCEGWQAAAAPHALPRTHVFALFLRAGKLLARTWRNEDLALLHQVRSLARPTQHRQALKLPAPRPVLVPGLAQRQQRARIGGAHSTHKSSANDTDVWPLLHRLLAAAQQWLPTAQPHEAAYILYTLGAAHKRRHSAASTAGGTARPSTSFLAKPIQTILQATQPLLPRMKHSHLARMIWGLGALGVAPSQEWMQAAEARCTARSAAFGTSSCLLLLEGLASLQHQPPPALLADLAQSLKPRLCWLRPGEQATLLHCLAALNFGPQPAWLHQFFQHSTSKIPGFTPAHFAQAASALARLRYVPPLWWVRRFMYYSHRGMGFFSAPELAVTAHSLVRLNLMPPRAWLHDALAVLRALPAPVGAGQPRKQPQQHQLDEENLEDGFVQQQQQQQQGLPHYGSLQHSYAQQQQQQQQQASSHQPEQPHSQRSPFTPHPSPPPPLFPTPLPQPPLDPQRHPTPQHTPSTPSTTGQAPPTSGYNHTAPSPPHQAPSPPLPPPPPPPTSQSNTLRQPPQRFPHTARHAQPSASHPSPTPSSSTTSSSVSAAVSSNDSAASTATSSTTSSVLPSSSTSSTESRSGRSTVPLPGYRIRVPAVLRPPLRARGAGRRAHRPPSHVSTLGDTARRRARIQAVPGSRVGSRAGWGATTFPRASSPTHTPPSLHHYHQQQQTQHGRVAAHQPTPSPSSRSTHGSRNVRSAHSTLSTRNAAQPPRWRPTHPLSLEDTYRTAYVIAKLHADPAVERHVSWARAQLPHLLRTLGDRPAHAYFPAACMPASRSRPLPTHSPRTNVGLSPPQPVATNTPPTPTMDAHTHISGPAPNTPSMPSVGAVGTLPSTAQPPPPQTEPTATNTPSTPFTGAGGAPSPTAQPPPLLPGSGVDVSQQHHHQSHIRGHSHTHARSQQQQQQQQQQHAAHDRQQQQQWQQQLLVDHLYICAELRYQPDAHEAAHLLGLIEPLLPSLTPSNCVAVTVCMAVLSLHPATHWVTAFLHRLQRVLPSLPASDIAKALIAAAHLRLPVGPDFTQAALEHAQNLDLVQLAALVRALDGSKVAESVAWLGSLRTSVKRLFSSRV